MSDKITYLMWFLILSEEHKLQVFQMKVWNKLFDTGNNTAPLTTWSKACELRVVREKSFQCLYRVAQKMYTLFTHQYFWNKFK